MSWTHALTRLQCATPSSLAPLDPTGRANPSGLLLSTRTQRQAGCDAQRIGAILLARRPSRQRKLDDRRDQQQRALSFDTLRMYLPFGGTRPAPYKGVRRAARRPPISNSPGNARRRASGCTITMRAIMTRRLGGS
jgi:hypothetical protein